MKQLCWSALVVLAALAVGCGGGGGDGDGGNGTTPPPADSALVLAALEDCGDLLGDMVGLYGIYAAEIDPTTSASEFQVVGTDAALGQIAITADLDNNGDFETNGAIVVLDPVSGEPPTGFDADAFALSLDSLGSTLAGTSGDVEARLDFVSVDPGGTELNGFMAAALTDGVVQTYDASTTGVGAGCSVITLLEQVAGTAFDGAFPSMTMDVRIDTPDIGMDVQIVFDGTQTASFTVTLAGGAQLTGTVDLDTGLFTLDP